MFILHILIMHKHTKFDMPATQPPTHPPNPPRLPPSLPLSLFFFLKLAEATKIFINNISSPPLSLPSFLEIPLYLSIHLCIIYSNAFR